MDAECSLEIKREMGLSELEAETIALFIYEGTPQQVQEDVSNLREIVSELGAPCCPRMRPRRSGRRGSIT